MLLLFGLYGYLCTFQFPFEYFSILLEQHSTTVIGTCCFTVADLAQNDEHATQLPSNLVTQTVYGFLDFTTTIGNTVMVFSPQSAPPPGLYKTFIITSLKSQNNVQCT